MKQPGVMCTSTPSTLLYVDESKTPREIHWLDLSGKEPKPAPGRKSIHTELRLIKDMCFIQDGDKQLLVAAGENEGLFAYNANKDRLEWKVVGKRRKMNENMDIEESPQMDVVGFLCLILIMTPYTCFLFLMVPTLDAC